MAEPHTMTATVRDCIRQMYAETASSVQQVFAQDQVNTILQLSQVKNCYGSDPINRVEGGYRLLDGTCWLAELCVGKTDAQASGIMTGTLLGSGSKVIGVFAQLELTRVVGLRRQWRSRKILGLCTPRPKPP